MDRIAQFEDSASRSRGSHEGEPSRPLCDRLSRTRDSSQRQLPTDHDHAVSTREYQTDQSSTKLPRLPLALSSIDKHHTHCRARLTGSLHISGLSLRVRYCEYGELDLSISTKKASIGGIGNDVAAHFASQVGGRGEDAACDHLAFDFGETRVRLG